MRRQSTSKFISAAVFLSAMSAAFGLVPASAQEAPEVAFVENVSGRVVAFAAGKLALLDTLDAVSDGTRLDLQANSELRICHYQTRQFLTLKGPTRASISRDGVVVENRKMVTAAGSCTAPVASTFAGGIVIRGLKATPVNDVPGKR